MRKAADEAGRDVSKTGSEALISPALLGSPSTSRSWRLPLSKTDGKRARLRVSQSGGDRLAAAGAATGSLPLEQMPLCSVWTATAQCCWPRHPPECTEAPRTRNRRPPTAPGSRAKPPQDGVLIRHPDGRARRGDSRTLGKPPFLGKAWTPLVPDTYETRTRQVRAM
jgi:hypothetical protein